MFSAKELYMKLSPEQLALAKKQMDEPPSTICVECGWSGKQQDKCPHCFVKMEK